MVSLKPLVAGALLAATLVAPAFADDFTQLDAALTSRSATKIEPVLADSVRVGPVLFRRCARR
jgi:hypothetical protein